MSRYLLTVAMNDNTIITFDSKQVGGLDHLFEKVGGFIAEVGNDNIRDCFITAVADDYVSGANHTPVENIRHQTPEGWEIQDPKVFELTPDFLVLPDSYKRPSPMRQALYAEHMAGIPLNRSPAPMVLEQLLSAQPVGAPFMLARRMSLANSVMRNTPEWTPFFDTEAYKAFLRLLDSPIPSCPEDIQVTKTGYINYRQAVIDYGTEHNLLKPLLPRH